MVSLHWEPDGTIREQDFLVGFELDDDVIGRPAYIVEGPDGAFYVSDDYAGVVWRVAYGELQGAIDQPVRLSARADPLAGVGSAELDDLSTAGQELYREHGCATCHEPDASPRGSAVKKLQGLGQRYSVESLALLLERPPSPMPPVPLDAEQRHALAVYLLLTR